jgi:hypothetical protein
VMLGSALIIENDGPRGVGLGVPNYESCQFT